MNKYIAFLIKSGKGPQREAFRQAYNEWKARKESGDQTMIPSPEFTKDNINEFYGSIKLEEFVAMAQTSKEFQQILNNVIDSDGKSFLSKIMEQIGKILKSIGINLNKNSLLYSTLESVQTLIDVNQKNVESTTEAEPTQQLTDLVKPVQQQGSTGEIKEGVGDLFESNSELSNIGTPEQYSQYLDTIFPDSQVRDIVYHGSIYSNKQKFKESTRVSGHYFATTPKEALQHAERQLSNSKDATLYGILLNIKNPRVIDKVIDYEDLDTEVKFTKGDELFYDGADGIIAEKVEEYNTTYKTPESTWIEKQIIVFEPEQIHILGSKQDIEGFKKFVTKPKFNPFDGRNLNPNDLIDEQLLPLQEDLEEFKRMCK
jgi:hypothetical protein